MLATHGRFANAKSANASWLSLKKKLLNGATVDAVNKAATPKKSKGKNIANEVGDDVEEPTSSAAASKKGVKAVKIEAADTEGGDADTEKTPSAETPKKSRAKKATTATKTDVTDDVSNDTAAPEVVTPKPKRKRGPNKPKDPNATPTKRAKKGAKAGITTTDGKDNNAANAQLQAGGDFAQTVAGNSMSGGDAKAKTEDVNEEGVSHPLDAEDKDTAMLDTHTEDQAA